MTLTVRTTLLALAVTASTTGPRVLAAQTHPTVDAPRRWEVQIATGSMMPVGALHDALRSAPRTAAQVSYLPRPRVAIVTTLGWARSRDLLAAGAPKVDALTADVGAEVRSLPRTLGTWVRVSGFAGGGVGMRRYDSRAVNVDASHHAATYAALGSDVIVRRVGLRIEARDYIGGFSPIAGHGEQIIANDVVVMTTLRLYRRPFGAR